MRRLSNGRGSTGVQMNQSPISSPAEDGAFEQLRHHLVRALQLLDEMRPSSISAARLQQVLDEVDREFGTPA